LRDNGLALAAGLTDDDQRFEPRTPHSAAYDEARDMNKNSAQGAEDPILQWVTFRLDNETYGINVMQVQEVLRYTEIAPVPGAPSYVLGIINLRGNVVTVIDTRQRFGLDSAPVTDNTRIVIIEADKQVVGIMVDSVAEVVYLRQSEVETAPNVGNDESAKFIQGVCNKNGELLILVELDKMMSEEEWSELESI
jgi:purine-binding chemotaxis protein CheW